MAFIRYSSDSTTSVSVRVVWLKISDSIFFFFELDFVVNRYKRRHTRHDAKHTIARTAPYLAPAPAAPPTPAPPRWERDEEMGQQRRSTSTYGRVQ